MKMSNVSAIAALVTATLACSVFVGGPPFPDTPSPVSTGSAQSLQDQIDQSVTAGGESGVVSVQITQDQLTSYLAAKLAKQTDPALTDPLVLVRNGQIEIYGRAHSGVFTANVSMYVQARVDGDGQPRLLITKTDFGPLAAPQDLNDALASFVSEAFTGWLGPVATGFRLESIDIGEGILTATGRIR
jgi:hypothetical protein